MILAAMFAIPVWVLVLLGGVAAAVLFVALKKGGG